MKEIKKKKRIEGKNNLFMDHQYVAFIHPIDVLAFFIDIKSLSGFEREKTVSLDVVYLRYLMMSIPLGLGSIKSSFRFQ